MIVFFFYNQVFVAENIKEVLPEYLLMLRGVLDCPELPLNVSRSYLQNDAYVRKVSAHIVKKVSDRLNFLFNNSREEFEKNWEGLKPYIQYGCIKDAKFCDRTRDVILFEKASGGWCTLPEYLEEKEEGTVYYTTDAKAQSYYLDLYAAKNISVLIFDTIMDTNYAQFCESKNDKVKFRRIDADLDAIKGEGETDTASLETLFKAAVGKEDAKVSFVTLGEEDLLCIAVLVTDNYGRQLMVADIPYEVRFDGKGGGELSYASRGIFDPDPANWTLVPGEV